MTGFKFTPPNKSKFEKCVELALFAAQEQILNDCNQYIKHLGGDLEQSANHTIKGLTLTLSWETPYAKRQWYTGKPSAESKRHHPKASIEWAAKAEHEYRKDWIKILEKGLADNL